MSMIGRRVAGLRLLQAGGAGAMAFLLHWLWFAIFFRLTSDREPVGFGTYLVCSLLVAGCVFADSLRAPSSSGTPLQVNMAAELRSAARQLGIVVLAVMFYLFAVKDQAISRLFFVSYMPFLFAGLLLTHGQFARRMAPLIFRDHWRCGVLLVGGHGEATALAAWLADKAMYGIRSVGRLGEPDGPAGEPGYLGEIGQLEHAIQTTGAAMVICAEIPSAPERLEQLSQTCEEHGVRLAFRCHLGAAIQERLTVFEENGMLLLGVRNEPLECPANRLLKRALDIAVALPAVLFLVPPLALLCKFFQWRYGAPGPLFYFQQRTGLRNTRFWMIKFRTMRVGHGDETRQATRDDDRVFRGGRWLRKYSLDEIPQFLNVLMGDMSVVGPRPHLTAHDEAFAKVRSGYRVRNLVKPGITGLAQIRGLRGETRVNQDIIDRTDCDLLYLENWSLSLDLFIIARTALQMVRAPATAY